MVDDNLDSAHTLAMILEIQGHPIRVAHDGLTALDAAREFHPDVVVLDIGLPGLDGYQVAQTLRLDEASHPNDPNDPPTDRLLLIAVTGYGRQSDRERTFAAGFDHHLTKPVDFDVLLQLIAG